MENAFEHSPAERTQMHQSELKQRLTAEPGGWTLLYFPRVDSLLLRNPSQRLDWTDVSQDKFGYGGYLYTLHFGQDDKVSIRADYDQATSQTTAQGEYSVHIATGLVLSFTTYTPLHQLINSELGAKADFVYRYTDAWGNLIFTTTSESGATRSYIRLIPNRGSRASEELSLQAYQNRLFFERMRNPQLRISRGSRVFFESDATFADSRGDRTKELERNRKRYHVFLKLRDKYEPIFSGYSGALGSGYVGTDWGLSFRPGFSYDSKTTFCDFAREGDKFVARLVRVYDTQTEKFRLESSHLYPQGEETSFVAEIYDAK